MKERTWLSTKNLWIRLIGPSSYECANGFSKDGEFVQFKIYLELFETFGVTPTMFIPLHRTTESILQHVFQ